MLTITGYVYISVYVYIYTYFAYTYIYTHIYICNVYTLYIYITISSRSDMERLSLKAHSFNVHGSQKKLAPQGHSDARGSSFWLSSHFWLPAMLPYAAIPWISCTKSCQPNAVVTLKGIQPTAWHFSDSKPFKTSKPDPRSFKIIGEVFHRFQ